MKELELTRGRIALVDDADFIWVYGYNWSYDGRYAAAYPKNVKTYLHKLLMGRMGVVDHINGNPLDNRRCNLRFVTYSQNTLNREPPYNPAGFLGVTPHRGKWMGQIKKNRKRIALGYYDTPEEAALAYDKAAKELHGEFAKFNFPRPK